MTTALDRTLRREILIDGKAYTLTLTTTGFTLVEKRHRKGIELLWKDLVASGGRDAGETSEQVGEPAQA